MAMFTRMPRNVNLIGPGNLNKKEEVPEPLDWGLKIKHYSGCGCNLDVLEEAPNKVLPPIPESEEEESSTSSSCDTYIVGEDNTNMPSKSQSQAIPSVHPPPQSKIPVKSCLRSGTREKLDNEDQFVKTPDVFVVGVQRKEPNKFLKLDENVKISEADEEEQENMSREPSVRFRFPFSNGRDNDDVIKSSSLGAGGVLPVTKTSGVYESLCAPSLNGASSFELSPVGAHIAQTWGSSTRNWILWTVWDSHLLGLPFFQEGMPRKDPEKDCVVMKCSKKMFYEMVGKSFRFLMDDDFAGLADMDYIALIITQENMEEGYLRYSQRLELAVKEVHFDVNRFAPAPHVCRLRMQKDVTKSIVACGSLAQILRAVAEAGDILVISGGFQFEPKGDDGRCCSLNFDKKHCTNLIRIRGVRLKEGNAIRLIEKIEPVECEDFRYKFTYSAQHDRTKREIIQHRQFSPDKFCRSVVDTLAYSRMRWDFPMPIVRGADPCETFDLILSPQFSMPSTPPRPSSPKRHLEEVESEPEESFATASATSKLVADESPATSSLLSSSKSSSISSEFLGAPETRLLPKENTLLNSSLKSSGFPQRKIFTSKPFSSDTDDDCPQESQSEYFPCFSQRSSQSQRSQRSLSQRSRSRSQMTAAVRGGYPPQPDPHATKLLTWIIFGMLLLFLTVILFVIWQSLRIDRSLCPALRRSKVSIGSGVNAKVIDGESSISSPWDNGYPETSWSASASSTTKNYASSVLQWFWVLVEWITDNCNLECLLAKLGLIDP